MLCAKAVETFWWKISCAITVFLYLRPMSQAITLNIRLEHLDTVQLFRVMAHYDQ